MNNTALSRNGLISHYLADLFRQTGIRAVVAVGVLIFLGLTEGVGLLMLIPFLQLIGIGDSAPSGIVAMVGELWTALGLPLNLLTVLAAYAGIVTVYALVLRWSTILNSKLSHAFTRSLRNRLFEDLARVQWLRFTQIRGSDINHVMTANLTAVDNGTYRLFALISAVFVVAVHVGVAMTLSFPLACVAMVCSCALLMLLRPFNRRSYRLGEEWRGTMAALYGVLSEHLAGMKMAKSYGAEERHVKSFCGLSERLEDQANRYAGILSSTQMCYDIGGVAVISLFFYVAVEILHVPATKLVIMVLLFARLLPQFSWMQRTWQGIQNMLPAYGAAVDLSDKLRTDREPAPQKPVQPMDLAEEVTFCDVSFRYDKGDTRAVLEGLDLRLKACQTTVILGPSGGGKSTLADLLMGLLTPDRGRILSDGKPLEGDLLHSWRRSVSYVPQESLLFHDSLRENLLWARPDATEEEMWEALRLAAADSFVSELPEGLETVVGDRGVRLSGGQRQRIALARALLRKPTLLLLDEATSSLDRESERRILDALGELRGKMTVVFISHRLSATRCADRVVTIEGGRVRGTDAEEPDSAQMNLRPCA